MSDDEFGGFGSGDDFGAEEEFGAGAEKVDEERFGGGFDDIDADGGAFGGFGNEDFEEFADDEEVDDTIHEEDEEQSEQTGVKQPKIQDAEKVRQNFMKEVQNKREQSAQAPDKVRARRTMPLVTDAAKNSRSIAINMNRDMTRASQPFTAGYDMTNNDWIDIKGLALRRLFLNCMMSAPGSFAVEVRTADLGGGECLAKETGITASANFGRTVIDFNDQPELKDDEKYFIHIILEQGAFKFQGAVVKQRKELHKFKVFKASESKWLDTNMTFVTKPVYQKPIPKFGDKCGFLLIKIVAKQSRGLSNRRMSLRRSTEKTGMRKFAILKGTGLTLSKNAENQDGKDYDLSELEYVQCKGGSMDTKDFNIVLASTELHCAATSVVECQKWIKAIEKAAKNTTREYGAAATTNMMF